MYCTGSVRLNPVTSHSCSGDELTFMCVVTNGDMIYWEVNYSNAAWSDVSTVRFTENDGQGATTSRRNNVDHTFNFTLVSTSPLLSTASTTVIPLLNGTRVICRESTSAHATSESVIHVVTGKNELLLKINFTIQIKTILSIFL